MTNMDDLREQVAWIESGDTVAVMLGSERTGFLSTTPAKATKDERDNLMLGPVALRWNDGRPGHFIASVLSHEPARKSRARRPHSLPPRAPEAKERPASVDDLHEQMLEAARFEGLTENAGSPHSWRCWHPDRYPGYCTCPSDLVDAILATPALVALIAERDALRADYISLEERSLEHIEARLLAERERDALRAKVADIADWHDTKAMKARQFRPEVNGENPVMDKAAVVHDDAARRLRAALDGDA